MSEQSVIEGFWAVIPAGGSGTRLWPLSRKASPKFLHDLTGSGQSLLRATWERLAPLAGEQFVVVTGALHEEAVRRQLPMLPQDAVLAEPSPRDSMPAIGLAAAVIERHDPDGVLGSFAADHVITDVPAFHAAVREAVAVARTGELVTIGIEPTHAATGFGYIRTGAPLEVAGAPSARRVDEFVEKPDAERAAAYVASGQFRWNAGMFVVRATTLLDLLAKEQPDMVDALRTIAAEPERLGELWLQLTKIAIDHAVAEPAAAAGRVAVVPAALGWDDVGDFDSLASLVPEVAGQTGLHVIGNPADVFALGATGLVATNGRPVAVIGIEDAVVVDTDDALLVTTRAHAQQVKSLIDLVDRRGRPDLV